MKDQYPSQLTLSPISTMNGTLRLPGSKSLSNRVILLSLLAQGSTTISNLLDSEDVRYMVSALAELDIPHQLNWDQHSLSIEGQNGRIRVAEANLFLGNAGTAMRPLTAVMTLGKGQYVLDGVQRMRERPIIDLVEGLQQLGAQITCADNGCPPVAITANGLPGGTTHLSGSISSQYLSAILMASPYAQQPVTIIIKNELVSLPYVQMTIDLMKQFGVQVENEENRKFVIPSQTYHSPTHYFVEGDASTASYFLAGAAITGGTVTVEGCGRKSVQGDIGFATVLEKMGAIVHWEDHSITVTGSGKLQGITINMNTMPDVAMTLAVVALFAQGETRIEDIYNWRVKETERMEAVSMELRRLGATVEVGRDYLVVQPPSQIQSATIQTYQDHRMAMAFSLAACKGVPITIDDPACVQKTFPQYFDVLSEMTATT